MSQEQKTPSRSEREALLKDKAGWVITVFAALLAVNTYISNDHSSTILNNTIKANDTYSFYQAKSIKQSLAETARDEAIDDGNLEKAKVLEAKIERYESDPVTGEGKKELLAKAQKLEAERNEIKQHKPWMTFAGTFLQLAIVLLSASILSVSSNLFRLSIGVGVFASILMSQGIWLWMPL